MDVSYLLKKRDWSEKALQDFGFVKSKSAYRFFGPLEDTGLTIALTISPASFTVQVLDPDINEVYEPFEATAYMGGFVESVRQKAFLFVEHVVDVCSVSRNLKDKLTTYVKETHGSDPEGPFEKYDYTTFRGPNGKWYGLIMTLPWTALGKERQGTVTVINLKLPPEKIEKLVDKEKCFPAYHMNKKYWLTVLLEGGASWEEVKALVDESYALTQAKKGRPPRTEQERGVREWLFPSNLKYYDLVSVFKKTKYQTWHHRVDIRVGDYVYMYITAPTAAILYKCVVTAIHLKPDKQGRKRFRMKRLVTYPPDVFTVDVMRQCGSGPVRSERSVPEELRKKLREYEEKTLSEK